MLVACAALITDPTIMARTASTVTMRANRRMRRAYTATPGGVHDAVSQPALYTSMVIWALTRLLRATVNSRMMGFDPVL
jgi:hypothetical protein